jgi:hypothetical protein
MTTTIEAISPRVLGLLLKVFKTMKENPNILRGYYTRYPLFERTKKISIRTLGDAAGNHLFANKKKEFALSNDEADLLRGFFKTELHKPEVIRQLLDNDPYDFLVEDYN